MLSAPFSLQQLLPLPGLSRRLVAVVSPLTSQLHLSRLHLKLIGLGIHEKYGLIENALNLRLGR